MPGGKLSKVRIGDENELLANYILEHIAFVTRVPREEDVGIDFFCSLIDRRSQIIEAGPSFAVQIKSNKNPIVYKKPHAVRWLSNQDNPLFIGTIDVPNGVLELFSTWRMMNAFLLFTPPKVRLIIGKQKSGDHIQYRKSKTSVDIHVGSPIMTLSISDLRNSTLVADRARILREWIVLDRLNSVRRNAKLFWVVGPAEVSTNKGLLESAKGQLEQRFFANPKNLQFTKDNFVRACIGFLRDLEATPNLPKALDALREQLRALLADNLNAFSENQRQLLREIGELSVE